MNSVQTDTFMKYELYNDDCIIALRQMPENSVDSIVTDPPAGIGFMGKNWDSDKGGRDNWIAWLTEAMTEALRVLKPGGHAVVWALPRTSHWTATALENAGFEIRDVVHHLFGSGFPKSHDISKAIDAEVAKQYDGYGTALKPAVEHWILCRKPIAEPTIASNVVKHRTGGLNIAACKVSGDAWYRSANGGDSGMWSGKKRIEQSSSGRFPANLTHDGSECVVQHFPHGKSVASAGRNGSGTPGVTTILAARKIDSVRGHNDAGSAARFFYCAKASPSDRDEGLKTFEAQQIYSRGGAAFEGISNSKNPARNIHPTVKNVELMRWLLRLVTPPGGVVLDCFMGSGSTGKAAMLEGMSFIGIEQSAEYCQIAQARIEHARKKVQPDLFSQVS